VTGVVDAAHARHHHVVVDGDAVGGRQAGNRGVEAPGGGHHGDIGERLDPGDRRQARLPSLEGVDRDFVAGGCRAEGLEDVGSGHEHALRDLEAGAGGLARRVEHPPEVGGHPGIRLRLPGLRGFGLHRSGWAQDAVVLAS